ncbi:thiamine pyrophosphate-binding protein [Christensenella intestinihominis]|uniref:thiamine pyrophosphate-binding protein n=1 Tax=Christensenella intestinihominis TaxID=1851429 RepID=UPI0008368783|nr:thiamine pyrophosphate-binding protein [Christensenella intestinihominis]
MKIRLADYVADFLAENGIHDVFTVVGGGAMHLNDALGKNKNLHCIYNHHEQACAIAAESYARIHNKIAAVCVTTGPGGTNAITGVVGGWTDSIPMFIISGQVKYSTCARSTGLPLRAMGDQEFDITRAVTCMTKYAEMVIDPNEIKYHLKRALFLAKNGRPGPVWLDIPVNVQSAVVETDELKDYDSAEDEKRENPVAPTQDITDEIIRRLKSAKRPIIYAGSGIMGAGVHPEFMRLVEKLNVPVVTAWNSIDEMYDEHPLYVGRGGIMGDRAGNFAVQNSDLILSLACRLSIRQVGYNYETWAREAYKIVVDIDEAELRKPTIAVDMPVHANVADIIRLLNKSAEGHVFDKEEWVKCCAEWKAKYPVVCPKHYEERELGNPYCFIKELAARLPEGQITVVGNGSACVVGSHGFHIKKDQRFIINSGIASMGYDLPAAIGACYASGGKEIICISGDGSLQMNIQELQTIITNRLPIKLFVINNQGYHSIRQTQNSFFGKPLVGIGPESGDLGFPDLEKIAQAYGYPFVRCEKNGQMGECIEKTLKNPEYAICEVMVTPEQNFEPKSSSRQLEDGTIVSPPLEDLAPFLDREELKENMIIPMVGEE